MYVGAQLKKGHQQVLVSLFITEKIRKIFSCYFFWLLQISFYVLHLVFHNVHVYGILLKRQISDRNV